MTIRASSHSTRDFMIDEQHLNDYYELIPETRLGKAKRGLGTD